MTDPRNEQAVWQAKSKFGNYWIDCADEADARRYEQQGYEIRALYPHPADARVPEGCVACGDSAQSVVPTKVVADIAAMFLRAAEGVTDKQAAVFEYCADQLKRTVLADYPSATQPAAKPEQGEPTYTTGHCERKKQPGGCDLHNLSCRYPDCDREAAQPKPAGEADSLVRRLDVALNGEDRAAPQASLCDIISQVEQINRRLGAPLLAVAKKPAGEAVDAEALARIANDMREWGTGEGCFNDDPEGKPLLCVYWAQQPYLKLCDEIEAIARRLSGQEG
jgi:hypothetical protein